MSPARVTRGLHGGALWAAGRSLPRRKKSDPPPETPEHERPRPKQSEAARLRVEAYLRGEAPIVRGEEALGLAGLAARRRKRHGLGASIPMMSTAADAASASRELAVDLGVKGGRR